MKGTAVRLSGCASRREGRGGGGGPDVGFATKKMHLQVVQIDIVAAQLEARNCTLPTHTSAAAAVRAWQHVRQGTGDQLHGGNVRAPEAMAQPR